MAPPASVDLIGSYPLGTCTKPRVMVDLAVTIPAVIIFLISWHHLKPWEHCVIVKSISQYRHWIVKGVVCYLIILLLGCPPPKGCCEPEVSQEKGSLPGRPGPVSHHLLWHWDHALFLSPWESTPTHSAADPSRYLTSHFQHTLQLAKKKKKSTSNHFFLYICVQLFSSVEMCCGCFR